MRRLLKIIIPKNVITYIRKVAYYFKIRKAFLSDAKSFYTVNMSDGTFNNYSSEKLETYIIYNAHSIEKGLTNIDFRIGFGEKAINSLFNYLNQYRDNNYDLSSYAYVFGISTLIAYSKKHKDYEFNTQKIDIFLAKHQASKLVDSNNCKGALEITKKNAEYYSSLNFENLTSTRKSVRDYHASPIGIEKINKAIEIASHTPSACNRQPWNVKIVQEKSQVNKLLSFQRGLKNYGSNIESLLVIYTSYHHALSINERHQVFIDCGMFSMSLLYALHSTGIASCALNASLSIEDENSILEELMIRRNDKIIMFISIGNYPDKFKVCQSTKKNINSIIS